jgi:hypothetical protein
MIVDEYVALNLPYFDAFALADIAADAVPNLSRMDLCNLVDTCETVIKEKTGYVCPFAGLIDAPNAWNPS